METINTVSILVVTYGFNIINLSISDIRKVDIKIWKVHAMNRMSHPKVDIDRVCLHRGQVERGVTQYCHWYWQQLGLCFKNEKSKSLYLFTKATHKGRNKFPWQERKIENEKRTELAQLKSKSKPEKPSTLQTGKTNHCRENIQKRVNNNDVNKWHCEHSHRKGGSDFISSSSVSVWWTSRRFLCKFGLLRGINFKRREMGIKEVDEGILGDQVITKPEIGYILVLVYINSRA